MKQVDMKMGAKEREHFVEWYYRKLVDSTFEMKKYNGSKNNSIKANVFSFRSIKKYTRSIKDRSDLKDVEYKAADYKPIKEALDLQIRLSVRLRNGVTLAVAVRDWGGMSLDTFYKKIGMNKLSEPPKVFYGPSRSAGHYDPKKNRIFIDPKKNKTNQQKLKTLEFEVGNAGNRQDLQALSAGGGTAVDKAWKSVKLEFKTSKREIQKILRQNKAKSYKDLVDKMGIPANILKTFKPRLYSKAMIKTKRVPMPSTTALKEKDKRTALFWYQVGKWSDSQILEEYAYRPHTPGSKISTLEQETKKYGG